MANYIETRKEISSRYLRHVVVIDDRILDGNDRVEPLFKGLNTELGQSGIGCHLFHYSATDPEGYDELERAAFLLAKASDLTILDWKLKEGGSSDEAIRILSHLNDQSGLRFVVIYTTDELSGVRDVIMDTFDRVQARSLAPAAEDPGIATHRGHHLSGLDTDKEAENSSPIESIQAKAVPVSHGKSESTSELNAKESTPTEPSPGRERSASPDLASDGVDLQNATGGLEAADDEDGEVQDIDAVLSDEAARTGLPEHQSYSIGERLFVLLIKKPNDHQELNAPEFLEHLRFGLMQAYTDHLHWAALEAAARIREVMPAVIQSLPVGTDAALIQQMLYQDSDEVAKQVARVVLDELREELDRDPLACVADDSLFSHLRSSMLELSRDHGKVSRIRRGNSDVPQPQVSAEVWERATIAEARNEAAGKSKGGYFKHPKQDETGGKDVDRQNAAVRASIRYIEAAVNSTTHQMSSKQWARARESVLKNSHGGHLTPGSIWAQQGNERELYLCIANACDCLRPKHPLIFAKGRRVPLTEKVNESGSRITQTIVTDNQVSWDSANIVAIDTNNEELWRTFSLVGQLRPEVTGRIIQRIWSHQSRVGVDGAEFVRVLRGE